MEPNSLQEILDKQTLPSDTGVSFHSTDSSSLLLPAPRKANHALLLDDRIRVTS
jgi:hypothetical protein